ncbi:MAG TPA: hypothetical protein VIQ79_31055, partial [Kribbella sp.]
MVRPGANLAAAAVVVAAVLAGCADVPLEGAPTPRAPSSAKPTGKPTSKPTGKPTSRPTPKPGPSTPPSSPKPSTPAATASTPPPAGNLLAAAPVTRSFPGRLP